MLRARCTRHDCAEIRRAGGNPCAFLPGVLRAWGFDSRYPSAPWQQPAAEDIAPNLAEPEGSSLPKLALSIPPSELTMLSGGKTDWPDHEDFCHSAGVIARPALQQRLRVGHAALPARPNLSSPSRFAI